MLRNTMLGSASALLILSGAALAQTAPAPVPAEKAMKLSEIIAKIEQRDGFRFISDIEWDREGTYDITYYTLDNAKVEIQIDAATGQPKPWEQ